MKAPTRARSRSLHRLRGNGVDGVKKKKKEEEEEEEERNGIIDGNGESGGKVEVPDAGKDGDS